MKIRALIAEFNPFHEGHKYIIDKMKDDGAVIAVMSGNFVQRGECAVFGKADRAVTAVKNGVDLVIELPLVYSLGAAERFARGSIEIIKSMGTADELWFGSECGDIKKICEAAEAIKDEGAALKKAIKENLRNGLSFPAARYAALKKMGSAGEILNSPNNILAAEYIRAIKSAHIPLTPITVKREPPHGEAFFSASDARRAIKDGRLLYEGLTPVFTESFDKIISAELKTAQKEYLMEFADCSREIASRLIKAASENTFDGILENAVCKNYTYGRIRRVMCNILTGNRFRMFPFPTYIRPLAFGKRGAELLKLIKKNSSIPVISRGASVKKDEIFKLECRGSDIYSLAKGTKGGEEYSFIPMYINY